MKATEKGFGFLEVDSKTNYFIPPPYMKKCVHGDKVVPSFIPKEREVARMKNWLNRSYSLYCTS
ncbi:hypothetical protein OK016_24955 [Vibrio chagasii]|nr:hypothetical protein [Vibrio chagasii]